MSASPYFMPPIPRRRRARSRSGVSPGPAALVLTSATYEPEASVTLTFGRDIDIAQIAPGAFIVYDGEISGARWVGTSATLMSAASVQIELTPDEEAPPGAVLMTAGPGNGIVAAGDGAAWAGVNELELPFGG